MKYEIFYFFTHLILHLSFSKSKKYVASSYTIKNLSMTVVNGLLSVIVYEI